MGKGRSFSMLRKDAFREQDTQMTNTCMKSWSILLVTRCIVS